MRQRSSLVSLFWVWLLQVPDLSFDFWNWKLETFLTGLKKESYTSAVRSSVPNFCQAHWAGVLDRRPRVHAKSA